MRISGWSSDVCSSDLDLCGLWRGDWRDADDSAPHLRAFTDRSPSDGGRPTMNDAGSIQGDLFALDSPLLTEVRGERSLMAFPFFALSKGKWTKTLAYKTDTVSIEIRSEDLRLGKECGITCRFRCSPIH